MRSSLLRSYYVCASFVRTLSMSSRLNAEKALQHTECLVKLKETFKIDEDNEYVVPFFKKAFFYADQIAVKDSIGEFTYFQLYESAKKLSIQLSNLVGSAACAHIIHIGSNDILTPLAQWACWMSGQVVVPLAADYSEDLLNSMARNVEGRMIISSAIHEPTAQKLADTLDIPLLVLDHSFLQSSEELPSSLQRLILTANNRAIIANTLNNDFYTISNAIILHTPANMGKPKPVVLTYKNLEARYRCLADAWELSSNDNFLHVLPTHQFNGLVDALFCPLSVGGKIIIHDQFKSHNAWSTILGINKSVKERVSVFMATPEIYSHLVEEYDKIFSKNARMVEYIENFCRNNCRVMICCSEPIPTVLFNRWREITAHNLLLCYGSCEVGTVLSNTYIEDKTSGRQRFNDCVGMPLPGIKARLIDNRKNVLTTVQGESNKGFWSKSQSNESFKNENHVDRPFENEDEANESFENEDQANEDDSTTVGQLYIAGPTVFKEYFNDIEATNNSFVDGFFRTDDVALCKNGVFKIVKRQANDEIPDIGTKKVSSDDIETVLLTHPNID